MKSFLLQTSPALKLKEAFDLTFHNKLDFDNFINLDVKNECKLFRINNKVVFNPSITLKKYLRFLNNFVFNYSEINVEVVHSYRKGKNAYTAVQRHTENKYFFQTDINNFFNSIAIEDINFILNNNLSRVPISDLNDYKDNILKLVTIDQVLPVGFSSSPNISNTCLYQFDNEFNTYCKKNEIIYTRYSDDIILSCQNKNNLKNIESIISNQLSIFHNDRIKLNQQKTKYTHKGEKIKILGMVILPCGKISVDMKLKKQLEILIHFYINDNDKFLDYLTNHYHGDLSKISGQLNYINSIDESYLNKLRRKYGNYVIDIFFHQTIKK